MPSGKNQPNTFFSKLILQKLKSLRRYELMKYRMVDDRAAVFISDKKNKEVGYKQTGIYNQQDRDGFDCLCRDKETAEDKRGVFRERQAHAAQDKKREQSNIRELIYNSRHPLPIAHRLVPCLQDK